VIAELQFWLLLQFLEDRCHVFVRGLNSRSVSQINRYTGLKYKA
jgi:hypothetical protein